MQTLDTDYLVIGAGAMGMAFTDALIDHTDVHVTIVDRRHGPGGHWLDAYPFVRLHQASVFYGVASTVLGSGAIQTTGPEAGLQERAGVAEICAYYDGIMQRRFVGSGKVSFLSGCDYRSGDDEHVVTSRVSGESVDVRVRRRVVDASYLAPTIPATTPPPFEVASDARVVPINALTALERDHSTYVMIGSGKTATDAIVWLLANGVDADRIMWVRPRDPWMLNRAVVQPDPTVIFGMAADISAAAADADTLDDLFLRLEDDGVMLRIDPSVTPTMARTPTLASWELDLLRTIENVVRLGHVHRVTRGAITLTEGTVTMDDDALVVHCAAAGLPNPPMVPIWGADRVRLQTIRAGFPCFNAALAGFVEATRDDDRERNHLCPPNMYPNSLAGWAEMQVRGARASARYGAESDIAAWADSCALNPSRLDAGQRDDPKVRAALDRAVEAGERGMSRLAMLAGLATPAAASTRPATFASNCE